MSEIHAVSFQVRDYELDMQGIVNNSVYGNYFEHARHEFLFSKAVDFAELANKGIHLVVVKIEISYKKSLRSRDTFKIETTIIRDSKLKFQFDQRIVDDDGSLIAKALVTGAAMDTTKNRPTNLDQLGAIFDT